jgi:hypothetical protein
VCYVCMTSQLGLMQGTLRIPGPTSPLSSHLLAGSSSNSSSSKAKAKTNKDTAATTTPVKSKFASLFPTSSSSSRRIGRNSSSGGSSSVSSSVPSQQQQQVGPNYFEVKVQSIGIRQEICIGRSGMYACMYVSPSLGCVCLCRD